MGFICSRFGIPLDFTDIFYHISSLLHTLRSLHNSPVISSLFRDPVPLDFLLLLQRLSKGLGILRALDS